MKIVSPSLEKKLVGWLFFLNGFGIMAWIPRFPEVKENLGLSNGSFGSLISTAAIGGILSLITVGHIAHNIGAKKVLISASSIMLISMAVIVHLHSSFLFLLCSISMGAGISAFHIAINGQVFHTQEKLDEQLLTRFQGLWGVGALSTAILSGLLVDRISLTAHINILSAAVYIAMITIITRLTSVLLTPDENEERDLSIKKLFLSFRIDWLVNAGLLCAIFMEFAIIDWATIFIKERLDMGAGLNSLPYVFFIGAMIVGRLSIHRFTTRETLHTWVVRASLLAGTSFILLVTIATHLPVSARNTAFILLCIGLFLTGIGSSFLGPSFLNAANHRSPSPGSIVVGQIGLINVIAIFICKWILAWTIEFTGSISLALMIPALMLLSVGFYARAVKEI